MIIFLYGTDTFRSRRQLKKMIEKFKQDRDPQGLNVVSLDMEKAEPGEVLQQVLASPFLAERRMVVIENLLVSKQQDLMKDLLERIEEKSLPESNVIVFWEATDKFRSKKAKEFFARLQKEKYSQPFDELKGVGLSAWIDQEVKERGGKISRHASDYLIQHTGGDVWQLNSLIDQLVSYKEEEEIQTTDVECFLDEKADDNIFNLVDAIVGKQEKRVYQMIQQQYKNGETAQYVFAMILRQFRILLQLRDLFEREDNLPSNLIAKKLGLHPFVVKKSLPLIRKYSMSDLKKIYQQLLDLDIKTKTGQGDQKVLLDLFVGRVCID